jgi:hypothetical protein
VNNYATPTVQIDFGILNSDIKNDIFDALSNISDHGGSERGTSSVSSSQESMQNYVIERIDNPDLNEINLGKRKGGRKSRRHKKRKSTLKRRGLKRRRTRKGKKRRHTKKRR